MVNERVVDELNLPTDGFINVRHAGGVAVAVPFYYVDLLLYNSAPVVDIRVGLTAMRDIDVIIGMDIINRGDFAVSNKNGATTFSFRIPSVEDFDFVKDDAARNN